MKYDKTHRYLICLFSLVFREYNLISIFLDIIDNNSDDKYNLHNSESVFAFRNLLLY